MVTLNGVGEYRGSWAGMADVNHPPDEKSWSRNLRPPGIHHPPMPQNVQAAIRGSSSISGATQRTDSKEADISNFSE